MNRPDGPLDRQTKKAAAQSAQRPRTLRSGTSRHIEVQLRARDDPAKVIADAGPQKHLSDFGCGVRGRDVQFRGFVGSEYVTAGSKFKADRQWLGRGGRRGFGTGLKLNRVQPRGRLGIGSRRYVGPHRDTHLGCLGFNSQGIAFPSFREYHLFLGRLDAFFQRVAALTDQQSADDSGPVGFHVGRKGVGLARADINPSPVGGEQGILHHACRRPAVKKRNGRFSRAHLDLQTVGSVKGRLL